MKPPLNCNLPGVINAIQAATTGFLAIASAGGIIPGLHGDPDNFIALILKDHSRDGGVNAPAHGYQDSSFILLHLRVQR